MSSVAEIIKEHRQRLGVSMRGLARMSGVSYGYIQMLESGKRLDVTSKIANKLAAAFGVDPDVFFHQRPVVKRPLSAILAELRHRINEIEAEGYPKECVRVPVFDAPKVTDGQKNGLDLSAPAETHVYADNPNPESRLAGVRLTETDPLYGFVPGDIIVMDVATRASDGDVVACTHDGHFSIKVYREENDAGCLQDPLHHHIPLNEVYIHGVVVDMRISVHSALTRGMHRKPPKARILEPSKTKESSRR